MSYFSNTQSFSGKVDALVERWLDGRIKPSKKTSLKKNHIFVFPSLYGWYYISMMVVLFIGGVNYGNSLILGFTFWSCSVFVMNIFHVYFNLRDLSFFGAKSFNGFVGDDALFEVMIENLGRHSRESVSLSFKNNRKIAFNLAGKSSKTICLHAKAVKRGRLNPGKILIESLFPLGLIRGWAWIDLDFESIIYPAPIPCHWEHAGLEESQENDSSFAKRTKIGTDDFDGLKNFQEGESIKRIDWKHWARTDELYSKVFVNNLHQGFSLRWEDFESQNIETTLSYLTYWVVQLTREGKSFSLELPTLSIESGTGSSHLDQCLNTLALWQLSES
jgi:uncharacterized protein (DUF58 family)